MTMVFAFIIQTLSPKSCDVLFYRFYSCYYVQGSKTNTKRFNNDNGKKSDTSFKTSHFEPDCLSSTNRVTKVFETSSERKDLLELISAKVGMQYTMKLKHFLLPLGQEASVRGNYIERKWKEESSIAVPVVWMSAGNLAFVLVCKKSENLLQAQNILEIITNQLEKHLQFISNPVASLATIETISLVVEKYLPLGEIIFMNSKLMKVFEKQLEAEMYA